MQCENCEIEHDGLFTSGRFCSISCSRSFATKFNREEVSKKVSISLGGTGILKKKEKNCLFCKKSLLKKNSKKYCSKECTIKASIQSNIIEKEKTGNLLNTKIARTYLIRTKGKICSICFIEKWQGQPVPLVMDHIDGNSDNNSIENCRLVCRNCDGLLPTFSGRNMGKGRQSLRMKKRKEARQKN